MAEAIRLGGKAAIVGNAGAVPWEASCPAAKQAATRKRATTGRWATH